MQIIKKQIIYTKINKLNGETLMEVYYFLEYSVRESTTTLSHHENKEEAGGLYESIHSLMEVNLVTNTLNTEENRKQSDLLLETIITKTMSLQQLLITNIY